LKALQRQQFEADFEVWLHQLPPERWRELLRNTPWAERKIVTEAVRSILCAAFAAERETCPSDEP
jgi:hypothetical protein